MPPIFERLAAGRTAFIAAVAALAALGLYYWLVILAPELPEGIAASNGRIEAEQALDQE